MSNSVLSREEEYLLKEYDSAIKLTYHLDELRNKLTSHFLTFSTIASGAIVYFFKEDSKHYETVSLVLLIVGIIALLITFILARLRKAEFEHFEIVNNVRSHFLSGNATLQDVVVLGTHTLPKARFFSGTYYWFLIIGFVGAIMFSAAVYIYLEFVKANGQPWLYLLTFVVSLAIHHIAYFLNAQYKYKHTEKDLNN